MTLKGAMSNAMRSGAIPAGGAPTGHVIRGKASGGKEPPEGGFTDVRSDAYRSGNYGNKIEEPAGRRPPSGNQQQNVQRVRVKVKAGQGANLLHTLGTCLTSCDAMTGAYTPAIPDRGQDHFRSADNKMETLPVKSPRVSPSQRRLVGSVESMTSARQADGRPANDVIVPEVAVSNWLTRPHSMVNLATHRLNLSSASSSSSSPEVLPTSGSVDAIHQAAFHTKTTSRQTRVLAPPASVKLRPPALQAPPTAPPTVPPRTKRKAPDVPGGLGVDDETCAVGVANETRGLGVANGTRAVGVANMVGVADGTRAVGVACERGRATADWVQLQRNLRMPPQVREEEDADLQEKKPKQLQAYVAWVNSQLKKKPGTHAIDDLSQMQDGVALSHIIEIVANERLEGVTLSPVTSAQMVANVEKVLHFMTSRRIRMHHTTAPDIVQGNPKSIMRLILALAAHYKPKSVKHSSPQGASGSVSPRSHPTLIGIAHGAAAALADARRDAAAVHPKPQRPRQLDNRFQESGGSDTDGWGVEAGRADPLRADTERGPAFGGRPPRERGELEGASCGSSPRSSISGSPKINRRLDFGVHSSRAQEFEPGYEREEEVAEACDSYEDVWGTLAEDHNDLTSDLALTKHQLQQLQQLLLSGQPPDGRADPESVPCEGSTAEEQLVVLRSQLQQSEDCSRDLREDLSKVRNEAMQLQGTKAGLQKRLADQEQAFLEMKAELLRVGFSQQSLRTEKSDLDRKVAEKDRMVLDLRRELAHRDQQIEELVASLQFQQQDKEMSTRALHAQIIELHEKLQLVGDTEVSLSHRLANQDRKMALLEGKLLHTQFDGPGSRPSSGRSTQSSNNDDIQVVRDSLQSLRSFVGNDPNHHTIDALEHSISSLMERLHMSEASRLSDSMNSTPGRSRVNYDSTGEARRSPISSLQMQGMHRLDSSSGSSGGSSTKVLYFTDRAVTPFMCTIPRRLGEITLRDVRSMFDRHGQYRFHFKAMDPEFGTVKEEITHDDDIIPGWDGKIVAWVEEDHA